MDLYLLLVHLDQMGQFRLSVQLALVYLVALQLMDALKTFDKYI